MTTATQFSLVLLGRFPGKDKPVAATLARDFGHDETWGMQVLGAAPIILLDGMSAEQSQAVHAALADVETAGSKFEIQPGVDPGLPKLGWPTPPRIKGRLVAEYGPAGAPTGMTTVALIVPCPYTGQKIRLTIGINMARVMEAAAVVPSPAAPSQIPAPPIPIPHPNPSAPSRASSGVKVVQQAYKQTPTPVGAPAVPLTRPPTSGAPAHAQKTTPGGSGVPAPLPRASQPDDLVIDGLEGLEGLEELDELQPMPQAPVPSADHGPATIPAPAARPPVRVLAAGVRPPIPVPTTIPAGQRRPSGPSPVRPPVAGAPLPDVPVLQSPAAPAPPQPINDALGTSSQPPLPADLMSAPMDLSAFEANVTASGIMRAAPVPGPGAPESAAPADDGSLWSVFMGRSTNPKIHQMVAELQGISVPEAAKLCQKPVVALAKDVPTAAAQSIKQQMAAVSIGVRLTKRN